MNVDINLIKRKFSDASPYLNHLTRYSKFKLKDFISNFEILHLSERFVEIVSQIIIDICMHISSRDPILSSPESYGDCISQLEGRKILPENLSMKIQKLIQLRNLIVHQYGKIDSDLLFVSISMIERNFKEFQSCVLIALDNK